jgi:serine phosphatase RsbU (regulator of sigma subunit)
MRLRVEPPRAPSFERELAAEAIAIGRLEGDIVVADSMMSRRHARLTPDGREWFVEDLGSRNGTTLNGAPIQGKTRLAPGDVLQLGETRVLIDSGRPPGSDASTTRTELPGSIFRRVTPIEAAPPPAADAAALERQADRLKLLNEFHRALAEPITTAALLDRLLARLCDVLRAEEGVVVLKNEAGEFVQAARRTASAGSPPLVSRRLIEEVAINGSAALVADVAVDARFGQAQSIVASGIRSIAAAPLADTTGSLGMIALYARARVHRCSEDDLDLLVSLASAAALRVRNLALAERELQRLTMERELALARQLQMSLLPRQLPTSSQVDVAATMAPAHAVGGDLYDFFVEQGVLWFVVADASGKGMSAALYMAMTRTLFRAAARGARVPSAAAARMNEELARDNEEQFFVTAVLGRLDLRTGDVLVTNAGHPAPLIVRGGVTEEHKPARPGIALGVLEDAIYADTTIRLAPGDGVVLFTDGVTEAHDTGSRLFESDRLAAALGAVPAGASASRLVDAVAERLAAFTGDAPQHDDITVVAIVFRGI